MLPLIFYYLNIFFDSDYYYFYWLLYFIYMSTCLPTYPLMYLPIYVPTYIPTEIFQPTDLSVPTCVYIPISTFLYISLYLPIILPTYVFLSTYPYLPLISAYITTYLLMPTYLTNIKLCFWKEYIVKYMMSYNKSLKMKSVHAQ